MRCRVVCGLSETIETFAPLTLCGVALAGANKRGTEGTLGIVTRAVLRLRPALRSRNTAFVAIDDYANVPVLLNALGGGLGGTLSAFEVLWQDFYDTVAINRDKHSPPVAGGHPWYALIEARGGDQGEDEARFERVLGEALEAGLIADAAVASSAKQRAAMWAKGQ